VSDIIVFLDSVSLADCGVQHRSLQAHAQELERQRVSDSLKKGLSKRPEREDLVESKKLPYFTCIQIRQKPAPTSLEFEAEPDIEIENEQTESVNNTLLWLLIKRYCTPFS
jgi:hypothetical protein